VALSTLSATEASPAGWEPESKDACDVEAKASRESNTLDEGLPLVCLLLILKRCMSRPWNNSLFS